MEHGRLCSLVDQCLRPLLVDIAARDSLTEETEKGLLLALSQVFRRVKQWRVEFDSEKDLPVNKTENSSGIFSCSDYRHCLSKTINDLVFCLGCDSRCVQHLAGNTLVAIAEFVTENGIDDFVDLLCLYLEQAISICLSSLPESDALKVRFSDIDPCISRSFSKAENVNWIVASGIFRVLRNILKHLLKQCDDDNRILAPYLNCVSPLLLRIPWDMMSKMFTCSNIDALNAHAEDVSLHRKVVVHPRELTLFFGNFIQFLCSLVEVSNYVDDGLHSLSVLREIINLVPKVVAWCHAMPQNHVRISHYFRHKVLMLMMKLTGSVTIDSSVLMSWIHLVHQCFEDLLLQPLSGNKEKCNQDDFLEGSPFSTSVSDPTRLNISSRHLQRLTVLIFLKCSIDFAIMKGISDDQQYTHEEYNNKGLMEISKWLESANVPVGFTDDDVYVDQCLRFSSSFLELFMHEDDILFKMLLQLLRLPFHADHRRTEENKAVVEAKQPYLKFLVSDFFNPVHLFHLFLAEILYDHQVLLDYLISKDTGSSCAEYLLRSLRIVCNSWNTFVEFPGAQEISDQCCSKRQKYDSDCLDIKVIQSLAPSNDGRILLHEKECSDVHEKRRKLSRRQPFLAATDCLMSLKTSIKSLHLKNLFPYNPKALLQRLTRFEELSSIKA